MTTSTRPLTDRELLGELEPVVASNLDRHLGAAREWFPHEYVPWDEGRSFERLGGTDWTPAQSRIDGVARTAMVLNLLTEDNLPSYHREIAAQFGRDGAWGEWVHRWTAEEGRHAIALRDYLVVTRAVDPVRLERQRMNLVSTGYAPTSEDALGNLAYTTFQELATRLSHRNTGRATGCPLADQLLARIAMDENLHMVFYRNLGRAAFDLAPDQMMRAVTDQLVAFAMPGAGLPDFTRSAAEIAFAGIYDLRQHHDEVLAPVLRFWNVFERSDLAAAGERARAELADFLTALDRRAARFVERRDARRARRSRTEPQPQEAS